MFPVHLSASLHPKLGSYGRTSSLVRTRRPNRRFASFAHCAHDPFPWLQHSFSGVLAASAEVPLSNESRSAGRVSAIAAVLLAVAVLLELMTGHRGRETPSFGAGYAAASNDADVQRAMRASGASPSTVCNKLVDQAISSNEPSTVVRDDFVSGCRHALVNAME